MQPCPYKILIGPLQHRRQIGPYIDDPNLRCFIQLSAKGSTSVPDFPPQAFELSYSTLRASILELLAQLPADWQPDLVVWWHHYSVIPTDLSLCPYPTVLMVSDSHIGLEYSEMLAQSVDFLLSDRFLVEHLQARGYDHVAYWPAYSFDPQIYCDLQLKRDIDLSFVGSYKFHPQRTQLLRQLSVLSDEYTLYFDDKTYGAEYNQILNRSKLVLNTSIRGEANLRTYEATHCGALLLVEEDNQEVQALLPFGEASVSYTPENILAVVRYYLNHEAERQRIAAQGQALIKVQSYGHHFQQLWSFWPQIQAAFAQRSSSAVPLEPRERLHLRQVCELNTSSAQFYTLRLANAGWEKYGSLPWKNALLASLTLQATRPPSRAILENLAQELQALEHPIVQNNLAWHALAGGKVDLALHATGLALKLLAQDLPWQDCQDFILPFGFNYFYLAWQQTYTLPQTEILAMQRDLLFWNLYLMQGQIYLNIQAWGLAYQAFESAWQVVPHLGETDLLLAWSAAQAGQILQALTWLEPALERNPFQVRAWGLLWPCLAQAGSPERLDYWRKQMGLLLAAAPKLNLAAV